MPIDPAHKAMAELMPDLDPLGQAIVATGYSLRDIIDNALADAETSCDTGYGFGEFCIDALIDGQAVRVIVKSGAGDDNG
jgi:hypothetical protein